MLHLPLPFDLADRYRLLSPIAQGGFASVYEATPLLRASTQVERVAVKITDVRRVERAGLDPRHELQVIAAVRQSGHAAWCRFYEWGELDLPADDGEDRPPDRILWIAMERLRGADLAELLAGFRLTGLHLPESLVRQFAHQFLPALQALHEQGVVHADLKPQNIRVENGVFRLFDFGISRFRQGETLAVLDQADDPGTGRILGSPRYLAPEQVSKRQVTRRTDIFSMGVLIYEMLTNRLPYPDLDPLGLPKVYHGRWNAEGSFVPAPESPPLVSKLRPNVGTAWDAPLRKAIQLDPYQRFEDADEFLRELPANVPLASSTDQLVLSASMARPRRGGRRGSRRGVALALAGGLTLGGAAGAGVVHLLERAGMTAPADGARALADARTQLYDLLLAKRVRDGGFSFTFARPSDHWSVAQALSAFTAAQSDLADPTLLADLYERIVRDALPPRPGTAFRGWGYSDRDTVAVMEASAWASIATALVDDRAAEGQAVPLAVRRRLVADWLVSAQNEDGSYSTIPALGAEASRVTATMLATIALSALGAREHEARPAILDAVERACVWLAEAYDERSAAFPPNPRTSYSSWQPVAGLTEQASYALLEGDALLQRAGRPTPAAVSAALRKVAAAFEPQADRPLVTVGNPPGEDYLFTLPANERTLLQPVRCTWYPWRLLLAHRLGTRAGTPKQEAWAEEARRLEARLVEAPAAIRHQPHFLLAELCFASALLARAERADAPASIVWLVSEGLDAGRPAGEE